MGSREEKGRERGEMRTSRGYVKRRYKNDPDSSFVRLVDSKMIRILLATWISLNRYRYFLRVVSNCSLVSVGKQSTRHQFSQWHCDVPCCCSYILTVFPISVLDEFTLKNFRFLITALVFWFHW